jgi:hypothetical protein
MFKNSYSFLEEGLQDGGALSDKNLGKEGTDVDRLVATNNNIHGGKNAIKGTKDKIVVYGVEKDVRSLFL